MSLTGENFFLAIATIAITVVGFSGVVATLRDPERSWTTNERSGWNAMNKHSFVSVGFGLLP